MNKGQTVKSKDRDLGLGTPITGDESPTAKRAHVRKGAAKGPRYAYHCTICGTWGTAFYKDPNGMANGAGTWMYCKPCRATDDDGEDSHPDLQLEVYDMRTPEGVAAHDAARSAEEKATRRASIKLVK